jgi:sterol desaturase/sphingolipid hydroxylase (fatty acid hydroxylase superfamily)
VNAALGALLIQTGLCGLGLSISLRMDREQQRATRRKPKTLGKRLYLIGFNIAMSNLLLSGSVWLLADKFPVTVPSLGVFVAQLAIIFVADDFVFYGVHRAMHESKWLYRRIHKIHHEAYAPVPIEFIYAHPLEVLAGGVGTALGLTLALAAFGEMSAWTLWSAVALRVAHELEIHSSVRRLTRALIPFYGGSEEHARHHERPTSGNYASTFTLWDRVFGTRSILDGEAVATRAQP